MRQNIPLELRALKQWVCAGPDKMPINPRTGQLASVTDPNTWASFEEADRTSYPNIGFVLTAYDPYTIIDLDNKMSKPCTPEQWARHEKILEAFDSYTERSTSGAGYHIVVKGRIPAGVHRDNVEVYSSARYMICTGDIVRNAPIGDFQNLLDTLYGEMQPAPTAPLEDYEAVADDDSVLEMASNAKNGEKFLSLCRGEWELLQYPSQSEADFALLSILAFYTNDNEQVRRLFRMSTLGKRDKASKDNRYLDRALGKIRAQQPTPIDFSELKLPEVLISPPPIIPGIALPPGIIGEIAQYIYDAAIRPVPEIALVAAISLVAGVVGRSYNISGSGLNQYIVILARTGSGKEGAQSGIDNLISAARPTYPMVDQFIGPSAFASGPALIKVLDEKPCFVSVLGEFGLTLQQWCDPRASAPQVTLKKAFLDLYAKSGWEKVLRASVYSDKEKNTKLVQAPNVTILGESTAEAFFNGLGTTHIAEGLIPRFSILEYTGPRAPRNRSANLPPSPGLVQRFGDLITIALTTSTNRTCASIQVETTALHLLDAYDMSCDAKINNAKNDVEMQLWNRAHLKALKMAGLLAVGVCPHNPVVTSDLASWAISFVDRDVGTVQNRFNSGDVGVGEAKQEFDLRRLISEYLARPAHALSGYGVIPEIHRDKVITYDYLRRRGRMISALANDKRGAAKALKDMLSDMVAGGALIQLSTKQVADRYKRRGEMYTLGEAWC